MNDLDTVSIRSGTFAMGSTDAEQQAQVGKPFVRRPDRSEGPQHEVTVSAFECMRFAVTRRLFAAVTGEDPLQRFFEFQKRIEQPTSAWSVEPDLAPVVWVRWLEAIRFCNALSQRKGLKPCYAIQGVASPVADFDAKVHWLRESDGYRLPTEAEWEYACRAGTSTQWSHGDDESALRRYAWYDERNDIDFSKYRHDPERVPRPVGGKLPNPWGLFDMHGNIHEWCYDAPRDYFPNPALDPVGDPVNINRAVRGGGHSTFAPSLRSAARFSKIRTQLSAGLGFRCVRGIPGN